MKPAMRIFFLLAALFLLLSQSHAGGAASVWDGAYSQSQAARGKSLYVTSCESCHGKMLEGSGQMPPLVGDEFKGDWDGQTLDDLFEKIQATMPGDKPGTLTRGQNADILKHVHSFV